MSFSTSSKIEYAPYSGFPDNPLTHNVVDFIRVHETTLYCNRSGCEETYTAHMTLDGTRRKANLYGWLFASERYQLDYCLDHWNSNA